MRISYCNGSSGWWKKESFIIFPRFDYGWSESGKLFVFSIIWGKGKWDWVVSGLKRS